MTARGIQRLVSDIEQCANMMLRWIDIEATGKQDVEYAVMCARLAGHYANLLIDLAEKGRAA